jgi:hypothetical protein
MVSPHERPVTRANPRVPATATAPPQHGAAPARARPPWRVVALLAIGVWRHVIRRVPLRYHPYYWALVFPLGMYGVATSRMIDATYVTALDWLPPLGARHRLRRLDADLLRAGRFRVARPAGWSCHSIAKAVTRRDTVTGVSRGERTSSLTAGTARPAVDMHDDWQSGQGRHLSEGSMARLKPIGPA